MINICFKSNCISSRVQINEIDRASKRNFARRNKTVLGRRGQAETSFKVEDWRSNTNVLQNVQITYTLYKAVTNIIQMSKRISQLFILNKLNIAENIPPPPPPPGKKIRIKRLWPRLWGPFLDSQAPSWPSEVRTDVPAEPPSHWAWKFIPA